MNKEHDYGAVRDNQLRVLEHLGILRVDWMEETKNAVRRPPEKHRRLVDPYDAKQDITLRARSYLHANCAQCHVAAGGGNAQMELEFTTELGEMRLIDVKPIHDTYGLPAARLVAPGHPEQSVLLHRISHRNAGHMPPLATSRVDPQAVRLMRDWIKQLRPSSHSEENKR